MAKSFSFPVYQIDFSAVAAGKRVATTKRRILWRFGFPNPAALEAGRTGTDCRGEEHEVVIVWSVTSGKRQIQMDGREVEFSSNRVGLIDFSWTMKGNHVLKVLCHASPPLQATPGFRQYDLSIDGQSFFNMPKVYELGVKGGAADDNRVPGHPQSFANVSPRSVYSESGYPGGGYRTSNPVARAPRSTAEEDEELRKAIQASLVESKNHLGERTPSVLTADTSEDLLGFSGNQEPPPANGYAPPSNGYAPAPAIGYAPAPPPGPAFGVPPAQPPYGSSQPGYGAPPPPQHGGYQQQPSPGYGAPAPGTPLLALPSTGGPPPPSPASSFASPTYAPSPHHYAPQTPSSQYGGAPPPTPPQQYGGAPPPTQQYAPQNYAPQTPVNQFAPTPTYASADNYGGHSLGDPFAPKAPTSSQVADGILKAYGGQNQHGGTPRQYQPGQPFEGETENQHVTLSMNGLAITEGKGEDGAPVNPFDAAVKKLVNFDNIEEPAEEQIKLTLKKEETAKNASKKSAPIPPAASRLVGSGATLSQISQVKPAAKIESVMKPPPGLFQGGSALVVHGQGPPPLQPAGFGMVHMQGQQQYGGYR